MTETPQKLSLAQWDDRFAQLHGAGLRQPSYGGPLGRHLNDGDFRLLKLKFDNSPAALRLWNFLLTEEDRLHQARERGHTIVGTMKDLGTVPVLAYAFADVTAFYPDGAWWTPCVMQMSDGLLDIADSLGVDESFCPVRAMLGAFVNEAHFPIPDLLICSVGAVCDDFSAIAQRLETMGHPIFWWEMPHRREPEPDEPSVTLPTTFTAPRSQVAMVQAELRRVASALEEKTGQRLDDAMLNQSIIRANELRRLLNELRQAVFTADVCPLPALEMLIAEMLAIHFCSDPGEAIAVIQQLLDEVRRRVDDSVGVLDREAVRVFWVNPPADLRVMNLLEECGGRLCGTDFMFCHAIDAIPQNLPPYEALAQMALGDPMVGSTSDRAARVAQDICGYGAEAAVICRIPGASHCPYDGQVIGEKIRSELRLPVVEIETPPVLDPLEPSLRTRLEALIETARSRRIT